MERVTDAIAGKTEYAIPDRVINAIRVVRDSGLVEMYDRETVLMLAVGFGHGEAADWLADHRHLYFLALSEANAGGRYPGERRRTVSCVDLRLTD